MNIKQRLVALHRCREGARSDSIWGTAYSVAQRIVLVENTFCTVKRDLV